MKSFLSTCRIYLLGITAYAFIKLLSFTYRWRWISQGDERAFGTESIADSSHAHWATGTPRMIAFWHGRQIFMPWIHHRGGSGSKKKDIYALVSMNGDGRIAALAIRLLGVKNIAGSSSNGGRTASRDLVATLERGDHAAITPDGPRGPRYEVKPGVVKIAQLSGAPISPVAYSATRTWTLKSWDHMIIPKPFATVTIVMGFPVHVPVELTPEGFEEYRIKIKEELDKVTHSADALSGYVDPWGRATSRVNNIPCLTSPLSSPSLCKAQVLVRYLPAKMSLSRRPLTMRW